MKNPTPQHIALLSATFPALIITGSFWFYIEYAGLNTPVYIYFIVFFTILLLNYFVFIYATGVYLYDKIKTIFKSIAKPGITNKKQFKIRFNKDVVSNISNNVKDALCANEEEIEQLRRLEEYRKQFLGDVSHELKTPIFHIQGYIDTLIEGGLEDENINRTYLKKAAKNVERLNAIVEDLEMISLIEDGKLNIEQEVFNIWELVNEIFDSLSNQAKSLEITLQFKREFKNPCMVIADKERMRQVLVNLISNSIKYGVKNGKCTVGAYNYENKILIEVSDNGIGIEEEHMPRIFERFYRVDKSRSRENGGTGLGLSIVKHIIEAHNQHIEVKSKPGEGSKFRFSLQKATKSYNLSLF